MPSNMVIFPLGIRGSYIASNIIIICSAKIRGPDMPSNVVIFSAEMWGLICHSNKLIFPYIP